VKARQDVPQVEAEQRALQRSEGAQRRALEQLLRHRHHRRVGVVATEEQLPGDRSSGEAPPSAHVLQQRSEREDDGQTRCEQLPAGSPAHGVLDRVPVEVVARSRADEHEADDALGHELRRDVDQREGGYGARRVTEQHDRAVGHELLQDLAEVGGEPVHVDRSPDGVGAPVTARVVADQSHPPRQVLPLGVQLARPGEQAVQHDHGELGVRVASHLCVQARPVVRGHCGAARGR
jgi:hypothetical protein